jgi:hypothetical protein
MAINRQHTEDATKSEVRTLIMESKDVLSALGRPRLSGPDRLHMPFGLTAYSPFFS